MKKIHIILGAITVAFLVLSCSTAVAKTNSEPVMDKIVEQKEINLFENVKPLPLGLISSLIAFIQALIAFIQEVMRLIGNIQILMNLVNIALSWVERIQNIINRIMDLIGRIIPGTA